MPSTRVHHLSNFDEFKDLCRDLGLRETDWHEEDGGLVTHAFEGGAMVRHIVYPR